MIEVVVGGSEAECVGTQWPEQPRVHSLDISLHQSADFTGAAGVTRVPPWRTISKAFLTGMSGLDIWRVEIANRSNLVTGLRLGINGVAEGVRVEAGAIVMS